MAEGDKQPENVEVQSKEDEVEEEDSSDSSVASESYQKTKRFKTMWGRICSGAHTLALKRGKKLQTNLTKEHPSFLKQMEWSHVVQKFVLDVPVEFCRLHLPKHNVEVILEDESRESYIVKFFPGAEGKFICGWKSFSVAHKLFESDVVVFHLVRPCYFKVYIIRANDHNGVSSTNLTSLNVQANEDFAGTKERKCEDAHIRDHSSSKEFHSSDMEVSPLSEHGADFEHHKRSENVKVQTGQEKEEDSSESWKLQTEEEEEDSSDSSCMVILQPPSLKSNIPSFSRRVLSLSRKKTYEQVDYDNVQTTKWCMTKRGGVDSEALVALPLERAKELQTKLPSEYPSFIRQMLPSNLIKKSALVVPVEFCRLHLPKDDAEVTLEDESGESYKVKFHPREKKRFIGGWNIFSAAHKLLEGDAVVFHLLRPCYFKVYIIRVNALRSSNVHKNEGTKKRKFQAPVEESVKRWSWLSNPSLEPGLDHSSSSNIESSPLSGRDADFLKFKIIVNGEIIDSELSISSRLKYYKLCCARESYLHEHLLKNVNRALASEIIKGTIQVADAIRACKLSTSTDDFATWDDTLEGFKRLGMDVGFLQDRLKGLASLESEFRETERVKRYEEAKNKRDCFRKDMKSIEQKFLELKRATEKLEDEMKTMKMDILKCKDSFQEKANAPW